MPETKKATVEELIGEKIYLARCEARMSQLFLAKQVHVSQQAMSDFETGKRQPKPSTLMDIAFETNKPLEYFNVRKHRNGSDRSN